MQGSINFDGTLSGSIAGGGGGGSEVTITPVVTTGTKIADYTIDETTGSLYAPTPETLPGTIVTKVLRKYNDDTQIKIATVTTLDTSNNQEVSQDIYAPSPVQCWYTPGLEQDYQIGQFTYAGVTQNVYIPYFQRPLTAGANINIDQDNVISANAINYTTTEFDTGKKWIDGKSIFCRTLQIDNFNINLTYGDLKYGSFNITDYITGTDLIFGVIDKSYIIASGDQRGIVSIQPEYPSILILNNRTISNVTLVVTLEYTKSV